MRNPKLNKLFLQQDFHNFDILICIKTSKSLYSITQVYLIPVLLILLFLSKSNIAQMIWLETGNDLLMWLKYPVDKFQKKHGYAELPYYQMSGSLSVSFGVNSFPKKFSLWEVKNGHYNFSLTFWHLSNHSPKTAALS